MASATSIVLKERLFNALKDNAALVALCKDIALEIQSGITKLFAFVEELGPYVTDKDVSTREAGITALSLVLTDLHKDFLNEAELHFITTFYCDRLKDHHSIIPTVLQGISAIVQMSHLPHDSPARLFRVMFEHVQCQSQLLHDRRKIYFIFTTLLENRKEDLKVMGPDFIYGIISAIDGERDPRNLMLLFSVLPHFIKEFPLGHLTEEMFEVIACYFPVDFNPSASEGVGITRDDLAEKLTPCLCAIPEFAEFCIPLITEKLVSSLKVAKLDSLSLLCKAAPVFGAKAFEQHLTELWSAIRTEVMPGGDVELRNASLKAVTSLIEVMSSDPTLLENFIDKIIIDTRSSLCDVQLSLYRPAQKLLETVALVNEVSCTQVLRVIIPLCLGQYSTRTSLTDKVILIDTLNSFIKISSNHSFPIKSVPELAWTDIPQLYLTELSVHNTELKSKILLGLTLQKAYLNDVHRGILYDTLCTIIETGCDQMKTICHTCIFAFATLYPQEILSLVKDKLLSNSDEENVQTQIHRLEALSVVAKTRELGIEVLPHLVSRATMANSEISFTALTCLHRLVTTKNIDFDIQHYLHNECDIMQKLTSLAIDATDRRLDLVSNICRLIVRSLTVDEQRKIVDKYAASLNEDTSETDAVLITNILIPLRKDIELKINLCLLENLYNLLHNCSSLNTQQAICKFISVMLNKMNDDDQCLREILSYFEEKTAQNLKSETDIKTKETSVMLQLWITKAMITKGSSNVQNFLNTLISILKHEEVGQYLAQKYKILTSKQEDALTEDNFCTVKILYKQRIFEHLLQQNHDFVDTSRQNYLTALVHLLEEVPVELLFLHLTKLVPLLIESLSLDNEQLIFSTLITLKLLLDTKNVIFCDKAQCFIPRFLKLLDYKTMRVRITAIECLMAYSNYPTILINMYKQDVLEKLAISIDDRKRLVRRIAVKARTKWFLIGAPGGIQEQ